MIRFYAHLAARGLWQSPVSLALMIAAVAAGVAFHFANRANLDGYSAELIDQGVTSGFGDVRVRAVGERRFEDAEAAAARLARLDGVTRAAVILSLPGAVGRAGHFEVAPVIGVDFSSRTPFRVGSGALDKNGIAMGGALAHRMGIALGDTVELRVILAEGPALDESVGRYALRVSAVAVGSFGAHESVFVDRAFLAAQLGEPRAGSTILLYARDPWTARALASQIPGAKAWMDDSPYLESALAANRNLARVSQAMAAIAVVIPIAALLYISVLNRRREVGLYSALGLGRGEVFVVFALEALLVAAAGIALGGALGLALVRCFAAHPIFDAAADGLVVRPLLTARGFVEPAVTIGLAALLAGVYPAFRAARTDAARVLRGLS